MSRTIHSLLFLFVIPIFGFAQTHDWALGLNVISGRAQINAQVVDDSSNVYIAGSFYGVLNLATDTFSFSSTSNQTIFLAKYDKDGNYISMSKISIKYAPLIFSDKDKELELIDEKYTSPIPDRFHWVKEKGNWAGDDEGMTGDELAQAVIQLHDIARLIETTMGIGNLSSDLRDCADRLHTLINE